MPTDFANLKLDSIILHKVYQRDQDGNRIEPFISSKLTKLDAAGLDTLQKRVSAVVGSGTHCIEMQIIKSGEGSAFRSAVKCMRLDEEGFIDESGSFATGLTEAQTHKKWPGGVLVVIKATIGAASKKCTIIIKAEIQEGFVEKDGDDAVEMEFLDNLLLTPQQKLYKVGLFIQETADPQDENDAENYCAFVFDSNISAKDERAAARYFYEAFLGLRIPQTAKHQTRDFYETTSAFINESAIATERKVDLHNALNTYLKTDQSAVIDPTGFAEQFFDLDYRDAYLEYAASKGIPDHAMPKDISFISKELKNRRMKFSSSVNISAPSEQFEELVQVIESDAESTTLKVLGRLLEQS